MTWTDRLRGATGRTVRGPYIQGRRGDRFIYLNWGSVDGDGRMDMFRRAKLMLDGVPADILASARGVRDARRPTSGSPTPSGQPLCAAVRPPVIEWSVG